MFLQNSAILRKEMGGNEDFVLSFNVVLLHPISKSPEWLLASVADRGGSPVCTRFRNHPNGLFALSLPIWLIRLICLMGLICFYVYFRVWRSQLTFGFEKGGECPVDI